MSVLLLLLALAQAPQAPAEEPASAPAPAKPRAPAVAPGAPGPGAATGAKPAAAAATPLPGPAVGEHGGHGDLPMYQEPPITPDGRVNRTKSDVRDDFSRVQRKIDSATQPGAGEGEDVVEMVGKITKKMQPPVSPSEDALLKESEVAPLASRPEPDQVRYFARAWFQALISGDARLATSMSAMPFQFEERTVRTPDDLKAEWLKTLRSRRVDLLELYDLEVLTPVEMEKKYGKPPARLSGLHWRDPKTYVVVGNLSGRAAVVVFRAVPAGFGWQAVGYHD